MKKKVLTCVALIVSTMILSGCEKITLTQDEEKLFIAYAVDSVLKFDYDYQEKLLDVEPETTPVNEETSQKNEENASTDNKNNESTTENTSEKETSMTELMGIEGFNFKINGYEVVKSYKGADGKAVMTAIEGKKLLVIKTYVTNNTASDKSLNMLQGNYKYTAVINGNKKLNPQIWGNDITLNVYDGSFKSGESKELLLVFQADENISPDTIRLIISHGDKSGYVNVR